MNCKNCGRQNPPGSLYCQDCGHRLGDWVPPERPGKMPTPPTGISRPREGAAALICPRCGAANAAHMRFCNNCGFQLGGAPLGAPAAGAVPGTAASGAAAPAVGASAAAPAVAASGAAAAGAAAPIPYGAPAAMPSGSPPVCWRCRASGDLGADFCKFCGARYADDPLRAHSVLPYAVPAPNGGGTPMVGAPSPALLQASGSAPAPPVAAGAPAAASSVRASPRDHAPSYVDSPRGAVEASPPRALLVAILKDGSDGRTFAIHEEQTDIGRTEGHLVLSDDPYLSPRHVRIVHRGGDQLTLRDLGSVNGVYVRLREPADLHDGDMILLGQQVLRFEVLSEGEMSLGPATQGGVLVFGTPEVPRIARLVQYTTEGVGRDVHYLWRDETVIGREQGDIVCTDDPFMSRRHAAITIDRRGRRFVLRDLGSSNGTALRIRGEHVLRPGDQFRIGRHLFRYDRPGSANLAGRGRNESA
jgi:pSer/pThr/pTyr-binding forkhead associated (FHA) protein